jgi:hypothetical protein
MREREEISPIDPDLADGEFAETPGRRLRVAVLLRALVDVEAGGRLRREALAWLLDAAPGGPGLRARDLFEELGLDPDACQRALRRRTGGVGLRRLALAVGALPALENAAPVPLAEDPARIVA